MEFHSGHSRLMFCAGREVGGTVQTILTAKRSRSLYKSSYM